MVYVQVQVYVYGAWCMCVVSYVWCLVSCVLCLVYVQWCVGVCMCGVHVSVWSGVHVSVWSGVWSGVWSVHLSVWSGVWSVHVWCAYECASECVECICACACGPVAEHQAAPLCLRRCGPPFQVQAGRRPDRLPWLVSE